MKTIKEAAAEWIDNFSYVPGTVIDKLSAFDANIAAYDSDSFRLLASPRIECLDCCAHYEGDLSLDELRGAAGTSDGIPCEYCESNKGDDWIVGRPEYAFPCGWGTLFAPKDSADLHWFSEHADEVAKLGFFVFESEDWDILLGIDAGGFDFYDAFWIPLYKLRGLRWHDVNESMAHNAEPNISVNCKKK